MKISLFKTIFDKAFGISRYPCRTSEVDIFCELIRRSLKINFHLGSFTHFRTFLLRSFPSLWYGNNVSRKMRRRKGYEEMRAPPSKATWYIWTDLEKIQWELLPLLSFFFLCTEKRFLLSRSRWKTYECAKTSSSPVMIIWVINISTARRGDQHEEAVSGWQCHHISTPLLGINHTTRQLA